jgi:large subunit ribosomal protein L32
MIVPARRTSRARRDLRRSHHALSRPARSNCPQCNEPRAPHRVCRNCGFYRGRTVLETEED